VWQIICEGHKWFAEDSDNEVNTYVHVFIFNGILSATQITASNGRIGLKGLEKRKIHPPPQKKKKLFATGN
jgi:hypothetical protein